MNKKDFRVQLKLSEKQKDLIISSLDFSYNLFSGNTLFLIDGLLDQAYILSDLFLNLLQKYSTGVKFRKLEQYIKMENIFEKIEEEKEKKKIMLKEKMKELNGLIAFEEKNERNEEEKNPLVKMMLPLLLYAEGDPTEITSEEANQLIQALDLYSRVLAGQFEEIKFRLLLGGLIERKNERRVERILENIKAIVYPFLSGREYLGIYQEDCPEESKITYDLIQVIRHKVAWHNSPGGGVTVDFGSPLKSSETEELCKIEIMPK